ncbi:MAG: hypothetical protein N2203_02390 [Bacteroidia bacterium]|nr:hypothetical protein [Bacteroidia bacterium]
MKKIFLILFFIWHENVIYAQDNLKQSTVSPKKEMESKSGFSENKKKIIQMSMYKNGEMKEIEITDESTLPPARREEMSMYKYPEKMKKKK